MAIEKSDKDYAELSDQDLVAGFRRGGKYGREVMVRVLAKLGMADKAEDPLMRQDGSPLTGEEGVPLLAVDYMSVAAEHSPADTVLLNFVGMSEDDSRFNPAKAAIESIVTGYLSPGAP